MKKLIRYFLLSFTAWFLIHTVYITMDGLNDEYMPSTCILILGNKVNEDGTLSARLKSRVDKGYEVYKKYQKLPMKIIVSGGLGKEGYYEGREMQKYLLKKGVPAEDIIVDDSARTTLQSAINYRKISSRHNFHSVILVSQFYHITRSRAMFRKNGAENIYTVHSDYFELRDIYSLTREFFAHYAFLFAG